MLCGIMRRRRLPRRRLTRSVRDPPREPRTGRAWRKAISLSEASPAGLGWHDEAGLQFVRLVLAGVFDRFPGLQVILGHWGEVVLFHLERMVGFDRAAKLKRPFADYARQNRAPEPRARTPTSPRAECSAKPTLSGASRSSGSTAACCKTQLPAGVGARSSPRPGRHSHSAMPRRL